MKPLRLPNAHRRHAPQGGFTLVELMVTLAVLAILIGVAIPSFSTLMASNRLTAATNNFVTAINLARMEALRRNQRVTLCKAAPGATSCDTSPSSSWGNGWVVFAEGGTAASLSLDTSTDTILSRGGGNLPADILVLGNGAAQTYISYVPDGTSRLFGGGFFAATVRVCSTSASLTNDTRARDIVISNSGRIILQTPTGVSNTCPAP